MEKIIKQTPRFRLYVKSYDGATPVMLNMPMHIQKFDFEEHWVLSFTEYQHFFAHECYEYRKPSEWHVMQYTGVMDKNGNEICEGDLVKHGLMGYKSPVEFERGAFILAGTIHTIRQYESSEMEIVGNIYSDNLSWVDESEEE